MTGVGISFIVMQIIQALITLASAWLQYKADGHQLRTSKYIKRMSKRERYHPDNPIDQPSEV